MTHTKHILLFLLLAYLPLSNAFAWKALLVGHRGSDRGVENTIEAFRNGISYYGCDGLECDVQVTKDNEYVLCHDSKLNNYGQNVVIGDYTLAELKALTLTQTRSVAGEASKITYTGTICTLEEYLQLCEDSAVFPVIELKSAKGLNGSNMTGFPKLFTMLQNHHLDSSAYIISFDENAILYVRQNYPSLTCQRLYMSHLMTDSDIDWCQQYGIEPSIDISYTNWDVHTVKRFYNAGLRVATWTINDVGTYNEFVRDRCCYMSTGDCVKKSQIADAPAINWDAIAEYKTTFSPFYVTPLDSFPASTDSVTNDTLTFMMDRHRLQLTANGKRGGFVIKDISALNRPTLYTQSASLSADAQIAFTLIRVSDQIVHVHGFANGVGFGGWYVSNGAPQYGAESIAVDPKDITIALGDTAMLIATVLPQRATTEVSWRTDKSRMITLLKEDRICKVVGKSLCDALIIASVDGKKDTCSLHVVQTTALPMTYDSKTTTQKIFNGSRMFITSPAGQYDLLGQKIKD